MGNGLAGGGALQGEGKGTSPGAEDPSPPPAGGAGRHRSRIRAGGPAARWTITAAAAFIALTTACTTTAADRPTTTASETTTTLARPVAYADRAAAYADAVLADEVAGNAYAYGDNYAEVPDYDAASGVHSLISDYADEDRAAAEAAATRP